MAVGNFDVRLKQVILVSKKDIADFVKKTYFDNKLKSISKTVTSNETRHVEVEKKVNDLLGKIKLLSTNEYSLLLCRINITGDDPFQNMFVYQPTFSILQLKKG